ncbi:MAG: hypothetical protein V4747_04255 [Pseudomonadota bacterium]
MTKSMFFPLLRAAFRQGVAEVLNTHRKNSIKRDIALVGSRRSGSTLLMQILGRSPGLKSIDQPFSIYSAESPQMKYLPWPAGGLFIDPDNQEEAELIKYVEDIRHGRLHVREPWRFWSPDFHFRSDRVLLKTTDAHYLTKLLRDLEFDVILYFRHPIPQALSCARNGWSDKIAHFRAHHILRSRILSDEQNTLLERVFASGNQLERYVLSWCLENLPLFAQAMSGVPTIYYEELVVNPQRVIQQIEAFCSVETTQQMKAMFTKESISVNGMSDKYGIAAIREGDVSAMIGRWRREVTAVDLNAVSQILACFPGCAYSTTQDTPVYNSEA